MNEIVSSTAASYYAYQPQTYSPLNSDEARPVVGAEVEKVNQPNANEQAANEQNPNANSNSSENDDSEEQAKQVIAQLEARDREVRTHEQAHLSAAGPHARGGINYEYQTGPDGKSYAVGGSVNIDTSPIADDPEATMQKARVVQQAALAPAEPSGQDMAVAAEAAQMMQQAQQEIREQAAEEGEDEAGVQNQSSAGEANLVRSTEDAPREATQQNSQQIQQEEQQANVSDRVKQDAAIPQRNEFDLRVSLQALDT